MLQAIRRFFISWAMFRALLILFTVLGLAGALALSVWVMLLSRDLPSELTLAEYNPPITSRVHAGDGTLIYEFADEHRVFVPYEAIPEHVVQAFVAAEDQNFFRHNGLDYVGIIRAARNSLINKITGSGGLQGGSTITQQVAKNMLLTNARAIQRKIKEAIVARRMEQAFSKEHILELYLNEIYLGGQSYGVGSAALNYFNKSLSELNIAEAAVLASLPKFPGRVNPYTNPERLVQRRNYVVGRMLADGYITQEQADTAIAEELTTTRRLRGPEYAAATYFVQELRRQLIAQFGEETLERGGLSIRTTIDTRLQLAAQEALQMGLEAYDRRHDYRGPIATLDVGSETVAEELAALRLPGGHGSWEGALVRSVSDSGARLLLADGFETALPPEDMEWSQTYTRENGQTGLKVGDVVLAEVLRRPLSADESAPAREGRVADDREAVPVSEPILVPTRLSQLRQIPEIEGAIVALDPHTGRVLAMMGGYSFFKSPFNRVTQARRQPGSAFKPFVFAAALENGYTPATSILDSSYVYYDDHTGEVWKPENYVEGQSYGEVTMRVALEKSYNQVTARVATDIGLEAVSEAGERFGVYDRLPAYPSMSLGAGETSPWRLARAYASFVNGGKEVVPTLLDRIQDRHGRTLFKFDARSCQGCVADEWTGEAPPLLPDDRRNIVDPIIAYQVVHMLEGVIERGTGRRALRVGKPLAGKTGTTNDYVDALFFGFSPDLVVGIWMGFDEPRSLGDGEGGGSVAAPVFTEFMSRALADRPGLPFRIPPGVRLVSIDPTTGELPDPASQTTILEAFRPGTEPGIRLPEQAELTLSGFGSRAARADTPLLPEIDPETGLFITEEVVEESLDDIY